MAFAEAPSIEKDPTKIEWLLAGTAVWLGTGAAPIEVPLGCEGKQGTRLRREVFVACADRPEVRVVSLDAQRVVRHVSIDRIAEAIYVRDGRVMVSVVSTFELATRPSTAADPAATVPAPPPVDPRIVEIDEVIAPPRADGTTEISFSMAALASVRRAGGGPTGTLSIVHRLRLPVAFRLEAPYALVVDGVGTVGIGSVAGLVSYDTWLFEVGLGAGPATLPLSPWRNDSGVIIPMFLRAGARDGVSVDFRGTAYTGEFLLHLGVGARARLPLSSRTSLEVSGAHTSFHTSSLGVHARRRVSEGRRFGALWFGISLG